MVDFRHILVLPDHPRPWGSHGQAHGVAGGEGCNLGYDPHIHASVELCAHIGCFPDPANPTNNPTRVSTGQQDTQGGRRYVTQRH